GCGLDDAGTRVGLHQAHQARQTLTAHHAVGIEHHHVAVVAAPAPAEVVDVAALALNPAPAPTVEDMAEAFHFAAQLHPGLLFGHADIRVVTVAEDEEIEVFELPGGLERLERRAQAGEHTRDVLVGDRHHQCGTCPW